MSESTENTQHPGTRRWAIALAVAAIGLAAGIAVGLRGVRGVQGEEGVQAFRRSGVQGATTDHRPPTTDGGPSASQGSTLKAQGSPPERLNARPVFDTVGTIAREAEAARWVRAVGVAVHDLRRDATFGVRADRVFKPASVIKLAVMVAAFQAREDGTIPEARFERLRPYLRRMITISDNPSTSYLVRVLGRERVNRAMARVGLQDTHLAFQPQRGGALVGSTATPAEIARLLAKLARREVVSPRASNEMLLLLGASQRRMRIPAGLPNHAGLWVGNKTGTLNGLVHDSAIVLDPAHGVAYTLAIFTEGARSEAAGDRVCIAISRAVYAAMLRAASPSPQAATLLQ